MEMFVAKQNHFKYRKEPWEMPFGLMNENSGMETKKFRSGGYKICC